MADRKYFNIKNYSTNGELAISRHVFETIASIAIKRVKEAKLYKGKEKGKTFGTYHPVTCSIRKDNRVEVKVDISVKKGANVKTTCEKIQDEISQSLMLACETVPFSVKINVAAIE